MKAEEKIPGGKLVCVEVTASGGNVGSLRITGDFFLHPEDAIARLESALVGGPLTISEADAESKLASALGNAQLIGVSCQDIARLFRRAVG